MLDIVTIKDFSKFYNDNEQFIKDRYKELSDLTGNKRELDVDIDHYQALIDQEVVTVFAIYKEDEFVGYISLIYSPSVINKGEVDVIVEHLAFDPKERRSGNAEEALNALSEVIKNFDVDKIFISLPDTEMHQKFANKLGLSVMYKMYFKELN